MMEELVMTQLLELTYDPEHFLKGWCADNSFSLVEQSLKSNTTATTATKMMSSERVPAVKSLEDESDNDMKTCPMSCLATPETDAVTELVNYLIRRNIRQGRDVPNIGCVGHFALMLHAYLVAPRPSAIKEVESEVGVPTQVTPSQGNETEPTPPQCLFAKIEELESQGYVSWSDSDDEYVDFEDSEVDWSIVAEKFGIRHQVAIAGSVENNRQ